MIEGVDFSSTNDADFAALAAVLKQNDKHFAGRYAVSDHAPGGRGMPQGEYPAYVAAELATFLYWESSAGWITGGYDVGVRAAQNAQSNIGSSGLPADAVVYFAADDDFTPEQQAAIDDTLRGCAAVLGIERVGIYGGYWIVKRCMENGSARWFCQTTAWSGGLILPQAHLLQYSYNAFFADTNCDLVRAFVPNYGQVGYHEATPPPVPEPTYAKIALPEQYARADVRETPSQFNDAAGNRWAPMRNRVQAKNATGGFSELDVHSPAARPKVQERERVNVHWAVQVKRGKKFYTDGFAYYLASHFTPDLPMPRARP